MEASSDNPSTRIKKKDRNTSAIVPVIAKRHEMFIEWNIRFPFDLFNLRRRRSRRDEGGKIQEKEDGKRETEKK